MPPPQYTISTILLALFVCYAAVYESITDTYRIGADKRFLPIISFADMENVYWYRLSVSADTKAHIGYLADMLKCVQWARNFKISKRN